MAHGLGLGAFTALDLGSVPGWGAKISQTMWGGEAGKATTTDGDTVMLNHKGLLPTIYVDIRAFEENST